MSSVEVTAAREPSFPLVTGHRRQCLLASMRQPQHQLVYQQSQQGQCEALSPQPPGPLSLTAISAYFCVSPATLPGLANKNTGNCFFETQDIPDALAQCSGAA